MGRCRSLAPIANAPDLSPRPAADAADTSRSVTFAIAETTTTVSSINHQIDGGGTLGGFLVWAGVQLGLVTCMGVFNPLYATYRLEQTGQDRVARVLSAWQVTKNLTIAALTRNDATIGPAARPAVSSTRLLC